MVYTELILYKLLALVSLIVSQSRHTGYTDKEKTPQ